MTKRNTTRTAPRARPAPPAGFPKEAAALWQSVVADYPVKHFRGANLALLETFCRARAFVSECDAAIKEHGLLIEGKANPAVGMRAQAWAEMRHCATKLRLAISSTLRAESKAARASESERLAKPWE